MGRSHECDFPEAVEKLPVCSRPRIDVEGTSLEVDRRVRDVFKVALSVYQVDESLLEELQPTHIVTQSQCEVCAVSLKDVERALAAELSCQPQLLSLRSESVEGVLDDIRETARFLGDPQKGADVSHRIRSEMDKIAERTSVISRRPSVACIEWIEPLMAAGHWMPELVRMAGAEPAFEPTVSPEIGWEDLLEADPDFIIVMPCGFDLARTETEMPFLTGHAAWDDLRAVRDHNVYVTDGNQYFNRPGPRLLESLLILAEILHPQIFQPRFEGAGWKKFSDVE